MYANRYRPGPTPETPDEELLRGCAAGDADALRLLFDRYKRLLATYLYSILGNAEDAEEAVADVFVKVWRGAMGFQGGSSVRSWLYSIATHAALDRLRSRRRMPAALMPFSELEAALVGSAADEPETAVLLDYQRRHERRALRGALGRLEPEERALIALRHVEGCSYKQISEITGQTLANVRSRLHRARLRLQRHFVALRDADEDLEPLDDTLENLTLDPVWLLSF